MKIEHESVEIEFCDPDVIHIRYVRLAQKYNHGGELVIHQSNADWLAGHLDAFADDPDRPRMRRTSEGDDIEVYGSGHEMDPFVNVLNNRAAAAAWARDWGIVLTAPYAKQLATLLRDAKPPHPLAQQLRGWAKKLCSVPSTSKQDLTAALDGAVSNPPPGVTRFSLDDREVGLGGVNIDIDPGTLRRADIEALFGEGMQLRRLDPKHLLHRQHEVRLPDVPHSCTVFVRYGFDEADDGVRHVKLRVDEPRPLTQSN